MHCRIIVCHPADGSRSGKVHAIRDEILKEEQMDHTDDELTRIDGKLEELQKDVMKKIGDSRDYDDVVDEIQDFRDRKADIQKRRAVENSNKEKIVRIREYLQEGNAEILGYSDKLVRDFVEKITVLPETVRVEVKSGDVEEIKA